MAFLKIPETSIQQKTMNQKQWVVISFRYDLPILTDNRFNAAKQQLNWGIQDHNGVDMTWGISQTSVEKYLDTIGPKTGTTVQVCKVRTGPEIKEVEYEVEYVSGDSEPRNIRQAAEALVAANTGPVPVNPPSQQTTPQQAPPQQPQPNMQQPAQPQPVQQFIYYAMSDQALSLFEVMLKDIHKVRKLSQDMVIPDPAYTKLNLEVRSAIATGNVITLANQLRAMAGGWNDRSDYGVFDGWLTQEAPAPPPEPWELPLEEKLARLNAVTGSGLQAGPFVEAVLEEITLLHSHIDSVQHTKGIIKNKLGYQSMPTADDAVAGMAEEIWTYEDARVEGLDDIEACVRVHDKHGRDLGMMPPCVGEKELPKEIEL